MTKSFVPYATSRKLAIVEVAAQPLAPADCSLGGFAASVAAAELGVVSPLLTIFHSQGKANVH